MEQCPGNIVTFKGYIYWCGKKLLQSEWLKTAQMYYLTVLEGQKCEMDFIGLKSMC